jgi:hypothetical protein
MAITRQTMTDEQRKSVAPEYLKAFDNRGVNLVRRLVEIRGATVGSRPTPRRLETDGLIDSMVGPLCGPNVKRP